MIRPAILIACLALAGCGGSSGGPSGTAFGAPGFADDIARTEDFLARVPFDQDVLPLANLPTGTATFRGQGVWVRGTLEDDGDTIFPDENDTSYLIENAVLTADARIAANFTRRTVDGTLRNFVREDETPLRGSLTVTGEIGPGDEGQALVLAGVGGTLGNDDVEGFANGGFVGEDAGLIALISELRGISGTGPVTGVIIGATD